MMKPPPMTPTLAEIERVLAEKRRELKAGSKMPKEHPIRSKRKK